ncbi:purine phosphoribosyltransferase family protein, partial [Escherichia sp. SS-MK2]
DLLVERYKNAGITKVVGTEARGFLFGAPVALGLGVGFVPVRKPGKLPRETISETYDLEYGTDQLEIHVDAIKPGDKQEATRFGADNFGNARIFVTLNQQV